MKKISPRTERANNAAQARAKRLEIIPRLIARRRDPVPLSRGAARIRKNLHVFRAILRNPDSLMIFAGWVERACEGSNLLVAQLVDLRHRRPVRLEPLDGCRVTL